MGGKHSNSGTGNPGPHTVGPAGENHGHFGSQYKPGAVSVREESELLSKHVAGLEVGRYQNVRVSSHIGLDTFNRGRFLADRIVKGEGAVHDGASDLSTIGHFAQRSSINRGRHLGCDRLDRSQNGDLWFFEPK